MKTIHLITLIFFQLLSIVSFTQQALEIEGAVLIGDTQSLSPEPGTIRWTGANYEGWNGEEWIPLNRGGVKDIDNNHYPVVQIGNQIWMAENLRVTHYNDGVPIPLVTDDMDWLDATTAAYSFYDYGLELPEYGALYNYYAVADTNSKNICPIGWHVPTIDDFNVLESYLGMSNAGGRIKESGLEHWDAPNTGANNATGFDIIPAGRRNPNGTFNYLRDRCYLWSKTESTDAAAIYFSLRFDQDFIGSGSLVKKVGCSVRCIKD